tara:strand:+ start:131 stop:499 length:369 start_codon:yes stop_codon:yes gene_type:complete
MTTIQELSSMTMLEIMEKMNKMEQENKAKTESLILLKNECKEKREENKRLVGYMNKMGEERAELLKKKVGSMDMTIEELEKEIKNAYQDLEDEENKNEKQENKITLLENKLRGIKRMLGNFK